MDKNKITLSFLTRKSLNCLLILFLLFCLFGVAQKAYSDPPLPPPDPVTIDPNPFDNWETTAVPPAPPPDAGTTVIAYFLYNDILRWIRIYDLGGSLVRDLVKPDCNYTGAPNKLAPGSSDVWNGRNNSNQRVAYDTYPYHVDDILFVGVTAETGSNSNVLDVAVDPTDSQKLWVTDGSGLWQSIDGGINWTDKTGSLTNSLGLHLGIDITSDGQRIFVTDKGSQSLHYSINGGTTWFNTSLSGYTNLHDIACNSDGSSLFVVNKDNKVYKATVSSCTLPNGPCTFSSWSTASTISGATDLTGVDVDPNNSNIIFATDPVATKVYKSTNGGNSFAIARSLTGCYEGGFYNTNGPYQVSIDESGNYWVSDRGLYRVNEFDSGNNWVMTVGYGTGSTTDNYKFDSNGNRLGIFVASSDGQPYLYVADLANQVIKKYAYTNYESDNVYENEPDDPFVVTQLDDKEPGMWDQPSYPQRNFINDLLAVITGPSSIDLTWTSLGDDYDHDPDVIPDSRAKTYHLKYSKELITGVNFDDAIDILGLGNPKKINRAEAYTKADLESNTTYYFAIKAEDDMIAGGSMGNLSAISNLPFAKTGLLWEWNMVSCPLEPSPDDSNSVFGDDAAIDWMWDWISTWSGAGDLDDPDYDGYWEQVTTITPGKGILLLSYDTMVPTDAPPASTPVADESRTFSLRSGWNLIGNPYEESVNLSDCSVTYTSTETYAVAVGNGWIGNAIYIWNGSTYDLFHYEMPPVAQLESWKGYWVFAYYDLDLIIPNPSSP